MKKLRLFRLRNGVVVREFRGSIHCFQPVENNGYISHYIVEVPSGKCEEGDKLILEPIQNGFPVGRAWGPDYDIVEEIKE